MTSFGLERPEASVSMACASQIGANPRFCDLLGPTEAKRTQDERTQGEGGRPAILDMRYVRYECRGYARGRGGAHAT